jgi:hypothetical protein
MPSSSQMTAEQMVNLVHYIRSMSTEQQREAAVLNRTTIVARHLATVPLEPDAATWRELPTASVRMTPLWWRDGADPGLQVQAAYDAATIALRLSWRDVSADWHATQSETFEDAVAVEIYRGDAEPFVGMGDPRVPVDVWFWDADRQTATDLEDQYPRVVADIYPFSESLAETAEYGRNATRRDQQPAVSVPAVAAGNPIAAARPASGASSLAAGGPGSVTFRLPTSQHVTARATWSDGQWSVVLARPLQLPAAESGVSLAAGDKVSAAFAVWNGSAQERDGMKLITIWQDLELAR